MDGYVLRKKRKLAQLTDVKQVEGDQFPTVSAGSEDDSTDVKLAILASLFPDIDQSSMLDILISSEGSVQQVRRVLSSSAETSPRKKTANGIGYQTSLASFQNAQAGFESTPVLPKVKTRKGQTLHLYTPEDIEMYTPCSIVHNFLPTDVAEDLLKELLEEASSFERQTFKMFDNVVQSPHSACFYVENLEEKNRQQTEYLYNGSFLTVSLRFHGFCDLVGHLW